MLRVWDVVEALGDLLPAVIAPPPVSACDGYAVMRAACHPHHWLVPNGLDQSRRSVVPIAAIPQGT
eukprot:31959_3